MKSHECKIMLKRKVEQQKHSTKQIHDNLHKKQVTMQQDLQDVMNDKDRLEKSIRAKENELDELKKGNQAKNLIREFKNKFSEEEFNQLKM